MKNTLTVRMFAGLLLPALVACGNPPENPPVQSPKIEGERVVFPAGSPQTAVLVSAPVEIQHSEKIRLNGRLAWDETRTVRVFPPVAGRIVRILRQPGEKVRAGDALAIISSPEFGQAQAESRRAEADLALAEKNLIRARELHEHGVIAVKELQTAEADHARAQAERQRTRARERLYGDTSRVDQQFPLRAPIDGIVVERNMNPGQEVRPDQAQPGSPALFVISDPDHLWLQLEVPEAALGAVRSGLPFALAVPGAPGKGFSGSIEHVADFIDPLTRTTKARGVVGNTEQRLKAEMFATAEIEVERGEFIRVPATAVMLFGDKRFVFVDEGAGSYRRQMIEAEETGLGTMRVASGIKPDERVVNDGGLLLRQLMAGSTR